MKLTQLKRIPLSGAHAGAVRGPGIRGTEAQDAPLATGVRGWRRHRLLLLVAGGALVLLLLALAFKGWLGTGQVVARDRLRIAEVSRGHFVRDVAADGTVVAAVNPTLFAIAPGTVSYVARARMVTTTSTRPRGRGSTGHSALSCPSAIKAAPNVGPTPSSRSRNTAQQGATARQVRWTHTCHRQRLTV